MRTFRRHMENMSTIFLIDSQGTLAGAVPLAKIVLAANDSHVGLTQEPLISTHAGREGKSVCGAIR